jgi:hypothetical protein
VSLVPYQLLDGWGVEGVEIAVDYELSCKCMSKARAVWVMEAKKNVTSPIFSDKVVFLISDV